MKPNEWFGLLSAIMMILCFITAVEAGILFFILGGVFACFTQIFLSWWGLTTFNDWYKKNL